MLMVFCDNKVKAILVKAHNGTLPEFQKLLSEKDMTRLCFLKAVAHHHMKPPCRPVGTKKNENYGCIRGPCSFIRWHSLNTVEQRSIITGGLRPRI